MKNFLKLILILTSSSFFGQQTNEELFKKDLDFLINDAQTGFSQTIGNLEQTKYGTKYYKVTKTLFELPSEKAGIGYMEESYSKSLKKNYPEIFYYYQSFSSKTSKGLFVFENVERIFDDIASSKKWKKKKIKQENTSDGRMEYEYLNKNKKTELRFVLNLTEKTSYIDIRSDLRPQNTGPNYLGCLVLYNVQLNQYVSASTYYVYGESLASSADLYSKIISGQSETFQRLYSKYEWMPNTNAQQVDQKMKSLNIKEDSHKIDTNGYSIN